MKIKDLVEFLSSLDQELTLKTYENHESYDNIPVIMSITDVRVEYHMKANTTECYLVLDDIKPLNIPPPPPYREPAD
jgi:hypothetical protein